MTDLPQDLKGSSCWKLVARMEELITSELAKGPRMDESLVGWAIAMRRAAATRMADADWEVVVADVPTP